MSIYNHKHIDMKSKWRYDGNRTRTKKGKSYAKGMLNVSEKKKK